MLVTREELVVCVILQIIYFAILINCDHGVLDSNESRQIMHDDKHRDVVEIIESRGFKAEEHEVITRDGYILKIQRIINPLISARHRAHMKPIVLQHGLVQSPVDWVLDSPNVRPARWPKRASSWRPEDNSGGVWVDGRWQDTQDRPNSLGFYMANRGFDVWITSNRCTLYGRKHHKYSSKNPNFWDFSLDELIKYDLPDTLDYILKYTRKRKIGYLGHSQGTTIMFGLLADQPRYNSIVEPVISLAPIVYVTRMNTKVKLIQYLLPFMEHVNAEFVGGRKLLSEMLPVICKPKLVRSEVCKRLIYVLTGHEDNEVNMDRSTTYLAHMPAGTSFKIVAHYGQMINSDKFSHFDHGKMGNLKKYHRVEPPLYDLSKVTSRSISLFVAKNDALVSDTDLNRLLDELPRRPHSIYNMSELVPMWNHLDYTHSLRTGELLNPRIVAVFREFDR